MQNCGTLLDGLYGVAPEIVQLLCELNINLVDTDFEVIDIKYASYYLNERCPVILLKKKM